MVADSPIVALGVHSPRVRTAIVEAVRTRHDRFADAHQIAGSRYLMGFASQWRDLLDDTREALTALGFRTYRLPPAGYQLPVVNDCLIYVWRVPDGVDPVARFASSPTRQNSFTATLPELALFETHLVAEDRPGSDTHTQTAPEDLIKTVGDTMPVVLVMVQSSPWQLQSIQWAIAVLDADGRVTLRGQDTIWAPEPHVEQPSNTHESFDSGTPTTPVVQARELEATEPDA